jgi:2-polyprenyl-3-methyl-5-hydroxy-6-metoxy-1,4-benzoquinol methylase
VTQTAAPDLAQIKSNMKSIWMAGDFGQIANYAVQAGVGFIQRTPIKPGSRVLDVACGTGNVSLPAAHAGAVVTGVDIATNLLEQARKRAADENLNIRFDEGDAEDLPYADGEFDIVVTMFGAMFAPRPERDGQLDPAGLCRQDFSAHGKNGPASARSSPTCALGR